MISQIKQKGFTIVELLIVIVVIAILAALSYVGYTSITARANNSTAAASAKAVKDAAQVYASAHGAWPTTKAQLVAGGTEGVAKMPSDIVFLPATSGAFGAITNGMGATAQSVIQAAGVTNPKTVSVYPCGSPVAGLRIVYKDFSSTTAKYMDAGDCSTPPVSTGNISLV